MIPVGVGRRSRHLWAVASVGSLLVVGVACGSDSGGDSPPPAASGTSSAASATEANASVAAAAELLPAPDPNQTLPPNDVGSLRRLYDPALAALGLRLTRGALIDRSNGGYEPSDRGTHLALYVEPLDDSFTLADYVEGLWTVAALVTPDVFARWADVETYDICQEPPPGVDDADEPLPYTQINLSRVVSDSIDWESGSLPDLLAVARTSADFDLVVAKEVRETPEYRAANEIAAGLAAQATTSTSGG